MKQLNIHYEDDSIVIVNKEPGILSVPDRFDPKRPNIQGLLQKSKREAYVVHRLDKDTSGAICYAKNAEVHRDLSLQFQNREVEKEYHLFVRGHPPQESGTITAPILKLKNGQALIDPKGKEAVSEYRLIKKFKHHALLSFRLLTGRMHQARIHAAEIGCPLIVDPLYSGTTAFYLSSVKRNYRVGKWKEERPLLKRTPLHAYKLGIRHPETGEKFTFAIPYPKDIRALDQQLSKWSSYEKNQRPNS